MQLIPLRRQWVVPEVPGQEGLFWAWCSHAVQVWVLWTCLATSFMGFRRARTQEICFEVAWVYFPKKKFTKTRKKTSAQLSYSGISKPLTV